MNDSVRKFKGFRFEAFWPRLQAYHDVVQAAWEKSTQVVNPFLRLHIKLQRTSKALRRWAKRLIGNTKVILCATAKLIEVFDVVQEFRPLSNLEIELRRDLKIKFLGLSAVEKLRAKQASRLVSIKAAEANGKLFFIQANGRRRKNFIHSLETTGGVRYTHDEKEAVLFQHFSSHFGPSAPREFTLNWDELQFMERDLSHLEEPFLEDEVHGIIQRDCGGQGARAGWFCWGFSKK